MDTADGRAGATSTEDGRTAVPFNEAATILGIGAEALRKRIARGKTIQAEKRGGEWYVFLTTDAGGTRATSSPDEDADGAGEDARGNHHPDAAIERLLDMLEAERNRNAQLERERAELYGRLGFFQAQLDQAKERIYVLERPRPDGLNTDPNHDPDASADVDALRAQVAELQRMVAGHQQQPRRRRFLIF